MSHHHSEHNHCCGDHHHHCNCCCSSHHHECSDNHTHDQTCGNEIFLELADQAWMEVLKEKIKAHIIANNKKLDELAAIISQANHERWAKKMEDRYQNESFNEKLDNFFKGH